MTNLPNPSHGDTGSQPTAPVVNEQTASATMPAETMPISPLLADRNGAAREPAAHVRDVAATSAANGCVQETHAAEGSAPPCPPAPPCAPESVGWAAGATSSAHAGSAAAAPARCTRFDRWLTRAILRRLGWPAIAVQLWNGEVIAAPGAVSPATVELRDRRALLRIAWQRELGFGEAYVDGRLEVPGGLVRFLECVGRCLVGRHDASPRFWKELRRACIRWWRRNTPARSRRNVHHHYDLGNDFYRLWLDEQLVYTCAYFPSPNCSLEQAQTAKLDHVCRKLRLRPGERVVEAGCGWGALALHMARHYGVHVRAYNLSHEQIVYAREQLRRQGLQGQVEFIEDDYRAMEGKYDVFVSVGMLEHVGRAQYAALGRTIDRVLLPHGRGLLHSIGRNWPQETDRWTARYVFPGGYAPSLREMLSVLEPHGFSVLDVENLRLHYARTLRHWLERFEAAAERVRQMFGERFVRLWRLYLAGSAAAFSAGSLQLFQILFARPTLNDLPWTRAHLYGDHPAADEPPCSPATC